MRVKKLHTSAKSQKKLLHGTGPSDGSIKLRIHYLYERALRRFKGDLSLWLRYLEHCRRIGATKRLGKTLARCLKLHPRAPELWCYAADMEVESNGNLEGARVLLQKALKLNPKCEVLWQELFCLELQFARRLYERRLALGLDDGTGKDLYDEDNEATLEDREEEKDSDEDNKASGKEQSSEQAMTHLIRGGIAKLVFDRALQAISKPSVPFVSGFLNTLSQFKPAYRGLGRHLCERLKSIHSNNAEAWETIAKYQFGITGTDSALEVFREGIATCLTEKMYCLCVDAMHEHSESLFSANEHMEAKELLLEIIAICESATQKGIVGEKIIQKHVKVLLQIGRHDEAIQVVIQASKITPQSCTIWLLLLRLHSRLNAEETTASSHRKLVEQAIDQVPVTQSAALWLYAFQWCETLDESDSMDWLLSRLEWALSVGGDISSSLQHVAIQAIDIVTSKCGVKKARIYMDKLFSLPRPGLSFMNHCIDFEMKQLAESNSPTIDRIQALLEAAISVYGQDEYNLWLRRWRIEKDRNGNSGQIYWRAVKSLRDPRRFVSAIQGPSFSI